MQIKKETKNTQEKQSKINIKTRFFIVLIVAIITIIIGYIAFRGTYLEMKEIGENYLSVFWQNIRYMAITLFGNFIVIYTMIYMTNIAIKKGLKEFFDQEKKQMPKLLNKSIAFISAIVISITTSSYILEKAMLCFNSAQFGMQDPIFGLDIGYFVFQKPFIELAIWYFLIATIALLAYMAAYYITSFNLFFDGVDRKILKTSKLIKQVTTLVMIIAILLAILILFKTQDIGTDKFLTLEDGQTSYSLYGAGFNDVTVKLWGYRILALVIVTSTYLGIRLFKQDKTRKLVLCIAMVPIYLVGMFFVMIVSETLFINNNELDTQKQYIEANIQYTKNAYGIDVEEISLNSTVENITAKELNEYQDILNNIAIVSKDIVLKDVQNGQTAKGYYSFRNTQIGKYYIDGKEQLIYLSPREMVNSSGTYNNKTYQYTHGYGAILTSAY